ncbi:MAG: hypothetical protein KDI17_08740 [Halioglobus sp.]|nr:hypothetical protein [Halioglobus sp.]
MKKAEQNTCNFRALAPAPGIRPSALPTRAAPLRFSQKYQLFGGVSSALAEPPDMHILGFTKTSK